jgi:hypothetical protein
MVRRGAISQLAGVAAHLSAAHDELSLAGLDGWAAELDSLLEIISAEISWLECGADSDTAL